MPFYKDIETERKTYTLWFKKPKAGISFNYCRDCSCPWISFSLYVLNKAIDLIFQTEETLFSVEIRFIKDFD